MPMKRQIVPRGSVSGSAPAAVGKASVAGKRGRGFFVDQVVVHGAGSGKVVHLPPWPIDPAQTVEVWPLPGNTGLVYTATNPDAVVSSVGMRAAQGAYSSVITYSGLDSLADLCVSSDVDQEGVLVRVLG
jgi:hypothetical protein